MSNPAPNSSPSYYDNTVREVVASYTNYVDAQAAVDRLSDEEFPVASTQIIGRDITTVETVTGRLTLGRAALMGAAAGAWFGLLIGLLFAIFAFGISYFAIVLSAVAFGALWGAIAGFVSHWATRGRRDFSSVQSLKAARYDVLVEASRAADAARILFTAPWL
ncbi:general stress protein [Marisediminicola senii]|uniref:general stress protein n=1 Tax=Marisediminicola senii TaxID=2711233 RepID=UPI0013EAEB52|nr:general stress protein [Marisediminicola senii]